MTTADNNKIVDFPKTEIDSAELIRRQRVEAERLARLAPGEWQLWIDGSAEQLGISRITLEESVKAIIKEHEKAARRSEKAAQREQAPPRKSSQAKAKAERTGVQNHKGTSGGGTRTPTR